MKVTAYPSPDSNQYELKVGGEKDALSVHSLFENHADKYGLEVAPWRAAEGAENLILFVVRDKDSRGNAEKKIKDVAANDPDIELSFPWKNRTED